MKIINDYPGSAIDILENNLKDNTVYLSLKKEGTAYSHYYNFKVQNNEKRVGRIYLKNLQNSPYYKEYLKQVPYIKTNGWEQLQNYSFNDNGELVIEILPNSTQEISLVPRYTNDDLKIFIKGINDNHLEFKDTPIPKIILGDTNLDKIILIARQHPGETLSSMFIEGVVKEVLTNFLLLKEYCFIVFPIVNTKGVENGNHRLTNDTDYNRSWNKKIKPTEITEIENILKDYKIKYFIDVHNDEITKDNYLRVNFNTYSKTIGGIKVLEVPKKYRRFFRALIKQRKVINLFNMTANEYIAKKHHCHTILVELSMMEPYKNIENLGKQFITDLIEKETKVSTKKRCRFKGEQ